MEQHKILFGKEKPLLLFSALDWGLGHVTRSIPLIRQLRDQGWEVIVACDSAQKKIFETEIYGLRFAELPGYGISYSSSRTATRFKMLLQIPKILTKIKKENLWLSNFLATQPVQMVISDNRYGFYSVSIPSVFITHQLYVITGLGGFFDRILQRFLYKYINNFSECWIPDCEIDGLAGKLSHPQHKPDIPTKYIGWLSRLSISDPGSLHAGVDVQAKNNVENIMRRGEDEFNYKYCIILSGPEPQRSILEKIVEEQFKNEPDSIIIRGVPGKNYIPSFELNKIISESEIIICRSGYTSMMELIQLKKKIIVIPTPGQSEQEYLAKYLSEKNYVIAIKQDDFNIKAIPF